MNGLRCVVSSLLLVTGCSAGEGFAEAAGAAVRALGMTTLEIIDSQPAAVRASAQVHCDTKGSCQDGGAPATGCVLRDPAFDVDFSARYASCTQSCGVEPGCFAQATPPRSSALPGDPRSNCLAALARCQVESDACDALAVLRDPSIAGAITACNSQGCDDMQACYRDAVLTPGRFVTDADAGRP